MQCYLQINVFGKQAADLLLDAEHRNDVARNKEKVKENRSILVRFIEAVGFLGNQEFPFRGHVIKRKKINGLSKCVGKFWSIFLISSWNQPRFFEFQIKIISLFHKIFGSKINSKLVIIQIFTIYLCIYICYRNLHIIIM